jgi:hypothetical protein
MQPEFLEFLGAKCIPKCAGIASQAYDQILQTDALLGTDIDTIHIQCLNDSDVRRQHELSLTSQRARNSGQTNVDQSVNNGLG